MVSVVCALGAVQASFTFRSVDGGPVALRELTVRATDSFGQRALTQDLLRALPLAKATRAAAGALLADYESLALDLAYTPGSGKRQYTKADFDLASAYITAPKGRIYETLEVELDLSRGALRSRIHRLREMGF